MDQLTDSDKMPFGKHKGDALVNVPAGYLIYIYENMDLHGPIKDYIKKNLDVLKAQAKRAQQQNRR